jgi:hypothetical protein
LRFRITIKPGPAPTELPELELFTSVMIDRRPKFPALLGSLAVHIVVLALIVAGSRYLSWYREDDVDWSRYRVEPLRLHTAEPIFFNASASGNPPEVAARPDRPVKSAIKATAHPAHSAVPGGLQLPSSRASVKDSPIILQPEPLPQTTRPPTALPPLAFWARQAPDLPKPRPREVAVPGRTEAPSPAPKPVGPPVLAVPNREAAVADVNIAMPPTPAQAPPALPVPNTATVPVRLPGVTEPRTASFESLPGDPVNIIALATERSPARNVEIPRGLQNIPASAAGDGATPRTDNDRSPGPAVDGSPQSAAQPAGASVPPKTTSTQPAGASVPPQTTSTRSSGASVPPQTASTHPSGVSVPPQTASTQPSGVSIPPQTVSTPPHEASTPGVIRIQHPANGSFDVVIMQSAVRDDLPDLAGMLTGNPVYTVYLNVGDQKDWLLEYCVPARENKQASPYEITVGDEGSVTPPYPISTLIPDSIRSQQTAKPIVLRGLLTAAGNLQVAKASDTGNSLIGQLVALVRQWQFRPALRNSKAIEVEVLLVIPSHAR